MKEKRDAHCAFLAAADKACRATYNTKEKYMLILTRKVGESIVINDDIKVTILGVKGMQVRIGIDAPKDVQVHREEIFKRIQAGSPAPEKGDEHHE